MQWTGEVVDQARVRFLDELPRERDAFVYAHQDILLETLESDGSPIIDDAQVEVSTL